MTDQTPDSTNAPPRLHKRRVAWHGLRVLAILGLAPLVFAGIAAALMIDRDITAPSWIKTRVSDRAALILGGGSLSFGDITVHIGRDLHPRVRLSDVKLRDATGAALAEINQIAGLMSPRGLLFERAALMQEVTLSGTQIAMRRNRDGSVAWAFETATATPVAASLPALMGQVETTFERPALAALEQVQIEDLVVNYTDLRAGRNWTVDGGRMTLDLRDGTTRLAGEAFLLTGGNVTELALETTSPRDSLAATIAIRVTDARATDIATQSGALSWLSALDAPLSAELATSLDDTGTLGPMTASLELGQGALRPAQGGAPLAFETARAVLTYQPDSDRIGFQDLSLVSDWGQLAGQGQALLRDVADGLPQTLLGQFTLRDIAVNPAGLYPAAIPITDAAVDLRLRLDPFKVEIGQAVVSGAGFAAVTTGRVEATPEGWQVAMDTQMPEISVQDLKAIWPESLKPSTRRWFDVNVHEGRLRDLVAGLRLVPGAAPVVSAGYAFDQTELRFMRTMPHMTGGHGSASLIDNRFVVVVDGAEVAAPTGGAVALSGSVLSIDDTRQKPATVHLDLEAQSTITAGLSLLDRPPFEVMTKAGRPVTLADGRSAVRGRISWPAVPREDRKPGQVRFDLTGDLTRLNSDLIVPGRQLSATRAALAVDNDRLEISGPITLDGVPIQGTWSRNLSAETSGQSNVVARIEVSPRFLDAFNIGLPPGTVTGRGTGDLVLDLQAGQPPGFTLSSDLRGVAMRLPQLGWAKPADTRGRLLVSGALGQPARIDRLEIAGAGLEASGQIRLTPQGQLDRAQFDRVTLGGWLNAPITLRGRGAGRPPSVEIGGGTVDFRSANFGAGTGEAGPADIALDRLQLTDGIALSGFRGSFTGAGGFSGQFRGQVNGGPSIQGTVVPQNGRSAIRLISDDAGGVANAAGLLTNASGGALDLTLLPAQGEGTFDGTLSVRGLRLRDAPAIAALLDAISVVGLLQQLDGQGLAFDEVDAKFRLTPREVIISEASAVGPGLGISLDGLYTLASKQLDLQGVISPIYLLNGIGSVLTRKGEGLIGFNYTVRGTADAPDVDVNPLSVLTPGMFREIFRQPAPVVPE